MRLGLALLGFGLLLTALAPAPRAFAQHLAEPAAWLEIEGRVTDLADGRPLAGVRVAAGRIETQSDGDGQFLLRLPRGRYRLRFEATGYGGATLVDGWHAADRAASAAEPLRFDVALPPTDPDSRRLRAAVDRLIEAAAPGAPAEQGAEDRGGTSAGDADSPDDDGPAAGGPVTLRALDDAETPPTTVRVLMPDGEIVAMDVETYLKGVVPAEMGYIFRRGFAALEAQAIASRTYALTRCLPASAGDPERCEPGLDANVDTTTRTQVWRPLHYDISDAAVESTRGRLARDLDGPLDTLFFARAVDRTQSSEDSRCCGGRAWPHLRSVASPDAFDRPWGHGAGMSQEGAAVLADWGATAAEIIGHYYTGARVEPPRPPQLFDAGIEPRQGDADTDFVFRLRYADPDGSPPLERELRIGQQLLEMPASPTARTDYSLGASYVLTTSLPIGEHPVRFRFVDGQGQARELEAGTVRVLAAGDEGTGESPAASISAEEPDDHGGSAEVQAGQADLPAEALQPVEPADLGAPEPLRSFGILPQDEGLAPDRPREVEGSAAEDDAGSVESDDAAEEEDRASLRLLEGPVIPADFEFMALAARWAGRLPDGGHVHLALRTSRDGEIWSEWTPLLDAGEDGRYLPASRSSTDGSGDAEGWSRLLVARGQFIQARAALHADPGGSPPRLEQIELHYFNSEAGPRAPTIPALGALAVDQGPSVISRAAWGADEGKRFDAEGDEIWPPFYTSPRAQIVHHTVTTNDPADPAAVVRSIYHYHAVTRGWGDIGYNYLIDHRGNIYEGRYGGERGDRVVQGGHALQYNSNSIGVALLGTFTEAGARPAAAAERAAVELLAAKGVRFGIDPETPVTLVGTRFAHAVMGHRDALPGHTQCPGDGLYGRLSSIRVGVRARMAELGGGGPPSTATAVPTAVPPSATPRPTGRPPTPQPRGCVELVQGGDFEQDDPAWQRNRAYYTAWDVFSGGRAIFIGLRNEDPDEAQSYASAVQTLRLPETVESARLRFAARSRGQDSDIRLLRLLDARGAVIALGSERLPANSDWTRYEYDLTRALAERTGQELRLYFGVINDGDGQRSYLRVDEVSLVTCDGGQSGNSPTASPQPTRPPTLTPGPTATPTEAPSTPPPAYPGPTSTAATATPGLAPRPVPICGTILSEGFESEDLAGWTPGGDLPVRSVDAPVLAGRSALRLGWSEPEEDRFGYAAVRRALRLPRGSISATLSMGLAQPSRGDEDAVLIELRRPATGERQILLRPDAQPAPEGEGPAWTRFRLPLPTSWLQGDFELMLALLDRGQAERPGSISSLMVDELAVEVCRLPGQAWLPFARR